MQWLISSPDGFCLRTKPLFLGGETAGLLWLTLEYEVEVHGEPELYVVDLLFYHQGGGNDSDC